MQGAGTPLFLFRMKLQYILALLAKALPTLSFPKGNRANGKRIKYDVSCETFGQNNAFFINGSWPPTPILAWEEENIEVVLDNLGSQDFEHYWYAPVPVTRNNATFTVSVPRHSSRKYIWRLPEKPSQSDVQHSTQRSEQDLGGLIYLKSNLPKPRLWSYISRLEKDIQQIQEAEDYPEILVIRDQPQENANNQKIYVGFMDETEKSGFSKRLTVCKPRMQRKREPGVQPNGRAKISNPSLSTSIQTPISQPCSNKNGFGGAINATNALCDGRKWINLRIISHYEGMTYTVSIDGHRMWVIAIDGSYIRPHLVESGGYAIGSHLSIMIELNSLYLHSDQICFPIRIMRYKPSETSVGQSALCYEGTSEGSHLLDIEEPSEESEGPLRDAKNNYVLNVTWGISETIGSPRKVFLINGKWPADPIVVQEGEPVEIQINNHSPLPFAEHWHGIFQEGSPEMDGVPGVSQWNIPPGGSYTYRWTAKGQYGAYWHHSHERGYYADGLRGALYVRPNPKRNRPWSLISENQEDVRQMQEAEDDPQLLLMTDHYHNTSIEIMDIVERSGVPPGCMDALLLNGKGRQYCLHPDVFPNYVSDIEKFLHDNYQHIMKGYSTKGCVCLVKPKPGYDAQTVFDSSLQPCRNTTGSVALFNAGKAIRLGRRWLNFQVIDGAVGWFYGLSIDGHRMWIVAVDGEYIHPRLVDFAEVAIGSRLSIMVELNPRHATGTPKEFPIRVTSTAVLQALEGIGYLTYNKEADTEKELTVEEGFKGLLFERESAKVDFNGNPREGTVVFDETTAVPFEPHPVPRVSNLTIRVLAAEMSLNAWSFASQPLDTAELGDVKPMLFNATNNVDNNQPHRYIKKGSVVDLIIQSNLSTPDGGPNPPHPTHLHGHKFHVLATGSGIFHWNTVEEAEKNGSVHFNYKNPPYRDGYPLPGGGWMVLRYVARNPGAHMLHCHIDDHLIMGMGSVILEGLEEVNPEKFGTNLTERPECLPSMSNDETGKQLKDSLNNWRKAWDWHPPKNDIESWGRPH